MTMLSARDVAAYIRSQSALTGKMQLLKLVYYTQAWHLAWEGEPLFADRVEAWRDGPVVRSLWQEAEPAADAEAVTSALARSTIDSVLEFYGKYTGNALSKMSHDQSPWIETRGDLPANAASNAPISMDAMRKWASSEALSGHSVPTRRSAPRKEAAPWDVSIYARRNAQKWAGTLEILAR